MSNIKVGDIISVEVTEIASYGVAVKYCAHKGFVQIPELSWDSYGLQNRVSNICKQGDVIWVKVLSKTDEKFYASLRGVIENLNPWGEDSNLVVGQELRGEVVLVADYGYLIKLPNFEVSVLPFEDEGPKLEREQIVDVRVVSVDESRKKIIIEMNK